MPKEVPEWEAVGLSMRDYIVLIYGRTPTQEEFERMYHAWMEEVERIYEGEE